VPDAQIRRHDGIPWMLRVRYTPIIHQSQRPGGTMAIVFVHGVNNRKSPSYDAGVLAKERFFRKHLKNAIVLGKPLPAQPAISFPYWGDVATEFRWNMDSLPRGEMQALGGAPEPNIQPLLAHLRDAFPNLESDQPLTSLAKKRLSLAVDVVNDLALQSTQQGDEAKVAAFVVEASAYAERNPTPAWVATIQTDEQFLARLNAELNAQQDVQALGGFGAVFNRIALAGARFKQVVKSAVGKAVDHAGDFLSTKLLASSRDSLNATLGRFFGDVFIYAKELGNSGSPGVIPSRVIDAFVAARATAPAEPLVVVGHSLGGVISFDVLTHFRANIDVDLFVTVGSQVAHFEEIKFYLNSDKNVKAPTKATTPANIKRWINIYDEVDIFSYTAERVFDRVDVDARYDTQTYTIKAHGAYFEQDRFYQRLRARIDALT
jgi:hypothetical protein